MCLHTFINLLVVDVYVVLYVYMVDVVVGKCGRINNIFIKMSLRGFEPLSLGPRPRILSIEL